MARYDDDGPEGNGFPWFLFGLGLGAALGILFAPQSGDHTRRALGKRARKLRRLAEEKLDDVMDTGSKQVRKLRENLAEVAEEFSEAEEDDEEEAFAPRPSRAREELERRLAAARARRRGAPAPAASPADDDEAGA
ncbi:MAG TPA: YtxH domain-containing protein [Gemmatimonadales bacterium]|jgi:gas vesicle protein|nr:YtxH domain-containing protein [Gemmatimonadales bacterium]